MVRRVLVTVLTAGTLLGASQLQAQTIGFKLGASFANWDFSDSDFSPDKVTSFMGGGFVRFGMGRIGIQPELLVVTRGAGYSVPGENEDLEFRVDYVEVPVLLVLPLTMGSSISPYVFGGPSIAFEIGCSVETGVGGVTVEGDCGDDSDRKSTDIGVTAGAGLSFPMGPGSLFLEGRYNWGLSNLFDDSGATTGDDFEVKSRTAAVLAGYSIWIGR